MKFVLLKRLLFQFMDLQLIWLRQFNRIQRFEFIRIVILIFILFLIFFMQLPLPLFAAVVVILQF